MDNDAVAGARAERRRRGYQYHAGAFGTLSTGFGIGVYVGDRFIGDEPGHKYLRPGAICGCGADGCIEAHISGSGIERNRGQRAEHIPHEDPRWRQIKDDFHDGMVLTVNRYNEEFDRMEVIGFTGAVAEGGPNMLPDLRDHLVRHLGAGVAPLILPAACGELSGLYGGAYAAQDLLRVR